MPGTPRTDPYVRNYLIRLLPRVRRPGATLERVTGLEPATQTLATSGSLVPGARPGVSVRARFASLHVRARVGLCSWPCRRFPALCPFRVCHARLLSPGPVSGACLLDRSFPWSDPFPPPPPPPAMRRGFCSRTSQVLWACPTSRRVCVAVVLAWIHGADLAAILFRGQTVGSPGSCSRDLYTCAGSSTTRGRARRLR